MQITLVSGDYDVTYNNNVLYRTTTNEVYLFDTATGTKTLKTTISTTQNLVSSNSYYFAIYDNSTVTTTYYFMDNNTAPLILNASAYNIDTATYTLNGTRYQIIKTQKDGVYSYKMIAISYPYVED